MMECAECGSEIVRRPRWTLRSDREFDTSDDSMTYDIEEDVHFCSDECESKWSFDRVLESMKEERDRLMEES